jgi:hypothetical protein
VVEQFPGWEGVMDRMIKDPSYPFESAAAEAIS